MRLMNTHKAGTYVIYGGKSDSIHVKINAYGHVDWCDDWEQISSSPSKTEKHRGDKAQYFRVGFGGHWFVGEGFYNAARYLGE